MKRAISILALTVFTVSMMSMTAFAHGGHGTNSGTRQTQYEVCAVDGCTQPGLHEHDGTYYYCANHGTGHGCGRW